MSRVSRTAPAIVAALATITVACGRGASTSDQSSATPGALGASTVSGRVTFEGTPPTPQRVRMDSDPLCMPDGAPTSELLVVGADGGVRNVFVYVKDGVHGSYAPPTTPVALDQKGCRYAPHVFGVQVGQPVSITNSDPAVHNVNAAARTNDGFNLIQQPKSQSSTRTFGKQEVMIPIRCDVHPWMNAWAGVVAHPFFAVTSDDGRFEIGRLPKGTYTIEAWHEQLGTATQTVTVDGTQPATVSFTLKKQAGG
jgi:plastocyanin